MELELDSKQGVVLWKTSAKKARENEIAWKMLENNRIEGLLPFDYYYIDELICFRYNYHSMQKIEDYFCRKKGGYESLCILCEGILKTVEKGAEYLLSDSGYLVQPEWIFWNRYEKKVCMCYLPGGGKDFQEEYTTLVEYLMEHTDHSDKMAVSFIYGLYDILTSEGFVLEDILDYIRGVQRNTDIAKIHEVTTILNTIEKKSAEEIPNKKISQLQGYILKKVCKNGKEGIINMFLEYTDNEKIVVAQEEVTVGRQRGCRLHLPYASISKEHAILFCENNILYVMDMASKNGTYLNEKKISAYVKTKCEEDDIITFADISYQVSGKPQDFHGILF